MQVQVNHIIHASRIREADPETVAELASSIGVVGLLNPLTVAVTPVVRDGRACDGYMLIAGLHRLEAVKQLGWEEVPVTVLDLTGPLAVMAECDENLCGPKLTAAERALFTKRRKEAYEALHPETRYEETRNGGLARQVGDPESRAPRFTADTAAKTGQSERAVQRDATRAERIAPEVLRQIAGTDLDKGKTLDELAALPKDQQAARVAEIAERRAVKPAPAILNEFETEEAWRGAMNRIWNRGSREWRERWMETAETPVFDRTRSA